MTMKELVKDIKAHAPKATAEQIAIVILDYYEFMELSFIRKGDVETIGHILKTEKNLHAWADNINKNW